MITNRGWALNELMNAGVTNIVVDNSGSRLVDSTDTATTLNYNAHCSSQCAGSGAMHYVAIVYLS